MAKTSGGVRSLGRRINAKENRFKEFKKNIKSGTYEKEHSYFSRSSGGFLLFEKGHNYNKEEIECGKILAKNGYKVKLSNEKGNVKVNI